jgi:hypothetical protein
MSNDDMEQLRMAPDVEAVLTDLSTIRNGIAEHNQKLVVAESPAGSRCD